jgi:hypothetical protein
LEGMIRSSRPVRKTPDTARRRSQRLLSFKRKS